MFGDVSPGIRARRGGFVSGGGHIQVTLAPAMANTVLGFPNAYCIGGEPRSIIEPLPDDYAPLSSTYLNLPPPGQS